jgi:SAM-dependent methyltransferase
MSDHEKGRVINSVATVADSLVKLKTSFGKHSERDLIVDRVFLLGQNNIKWLDIGIGDCSSTFKMVSSLNDKAVQVDVEGADPELDKTISSKAKNLGFKVFKEGIEDLSLEIKNFDVINIRQSIYYVASPLEAIQKIINEAKSGAIIFITIWNDRCHFRGLQQYIFQNLEIGRKIVSSGALADEFNKLSDVCTFESVDVAGDLDVGVWTSSEDYTIAAFDVASRNCCADISPEEKVKIVTGYINSVKNVPLKRINTLFTIHRI